jgi:hypothetical protein
MLLSPIVAVSQKPQTMELKNVTLDYSALLKDTYRIMSILNFRIRDNVKKDGYLQPCVNVQRDNSFAAGFAYNPENLVGSKTDTSRYFRYSILHMSISLYSIISKQKDTTFESYEEAKSIVVHELAHYLQQTNNIPYIEATDNNRTEYISQPSEFEAHSVGCYYFLEKYDRKELKRIVNLKMPVKEKCKLIINQYWRIIYPNSGVVFLSDNK